MLSKSILFLSSILVLLVIFYCVQNNRVFIFYFKYNVPEKLLFRDYLIKFNKSYDKTEYQMRYHHFKENLVKIEKLNRGSRHAIYGVTKFSDWAKEELAAITIPNVGNCEPVGMSCGRIRRLTENKRNKYRKYWRVGPVLDQKLCPACWAYSIIGVMESRAFIQNYGFTRLSIQELLDCSFFKQKAMTGCHAGRPVVSALKYLCAKQLKITTEAKYPLTLVEEKCRGTARGLRGISRFVNSCDMYKNETRLLEVLAEGPVTAMVTAALLYNYVEGIIDYNCETTEDKVNHAVQIVGYDTTGDKHYYTIKNSWGTTWGEGGNARLAIGGNQCGIAFSIGYFDVN